ncbi:MAG: DUF6199 family natural product biosynthesis protein [Oscillospiraceae bacterium]
MKRSLLMGIVLFLLLLTACGKNTGDPNVYDVEYGGKTYTVDQNNQTITFDGHVCEFELSGNGNSMRFKVTYPDGSTYFWNQTGNTGEGGWSDDYDAERYVSGDTLWSVLEQGRPSARNNSGHWFLGVLLVAAGIFQAASPRTLWYISHGWRYKDAEPSDLALGLGRIGGGVVVIIGIICFFI